MRGEEVCEGLSREKVKVRSAGTRWGRASRAGSTLASWSRQTPSVDRFTSLRPK